MGWDGSIIYRERRTRGVFFGGGNYFGRRVVSRYPRPPSADPGRHEKGGRKSDNYNYIYSEYNNRNIIQVYTFLFFFPPLLLLFLLLVYYTISYIYMSSSLLSPPFSSI